MKNRYYNSKVKELLEIDTAVVRYGQDKVLNRDRLTLLRQMRGNLFSKKWKHSIEIWRHFVLSDGFALYIDQFENGFNHCGQNIML